MSGAGSSSAGFSSRSSHRALRDTHHYRYTPRMLHHYREEPLFDSESEPESEPAPKKGCKLRVECWHAPKAAPPPAPNKKDFKTVLEEHRDELLARDRDREQELIAERRKHELDKKVKDAFASWKEQQKRSRRIEDRWHQHRLAEEDDLRWKALRAAYDPAEVPDEQITSWYDAAHRNLHRQFRGFELGQIGRNNTVPHRTVIPSLEEVLYAPMPDPHKATIEDPPKGDVRDHRLLPPPRAHPVPFRGRGEDDDEDTALVNELLMQLDEVNRQLEQVKAYEWAYRGSEQAKVVKRLELEQRRLAAELGQATLVERRNTEAIEVQRREDDYRLWREQREAEARGDDGDDEAGDGDRPAEQ